jgi:hypothetical protein
MAKMHSYPENPSPLEIILTDARNDLLSAEDSLRRAAERLARRAERIGELLDAGYHVNELGEIQHAGAEVDRYCALREERIAGIRRLEWAAQKAAEAGWAADLDAEADRRSEGR